ncbi:hypothetical protein CWI38_0370p0020 [Hamiltosporidium tvaerminnensis]|uniref:Uncharacterized protein n=1 Tax=Hamiltosporidium tvaerminnensis TaxID=1176355 RepID=A0A4Q9M005_9MICR|nr:hypothetical protein CWI38_0458p0020 [Hamiltosporidium tvaerminnensis]TBU13653.1 hypothetical protein CWI38_0370p0020 [Hamiltosporidium tvaerminnensis]
MKLKAYIQFIVFEKAIETISFDKRKKLYAICVILGTRMDKQPTPLLTQVDNEEKNIKPFILDGITTVKERGTDNKLNKHFEKYKKRIIESKDPNKTIRNLLIGDKVLIKKGF